MPGIGVDARRREKPQQIADELRRLIVEGDLADGASLGHEPDLIQRFGVSRPSLREALRILEAEGLITVVRGVLGGVVVRQPDHRTAARTAALVLQSRDVRLEDVFDARSILEPAAVRIVASARNHKASGKRLRELVAAQEAAKDDVEAFGAANAQFHRELVAMAGNQTLTIMAEMITEVVERVVVSLARVKQKDSAASRRRGMESQTLLADLTARGEADAAEEHWRSHMALVGKLIVGTEAKTVIDLLDHFE